MGKENEENKAVKPVSGLKSFLSGGVGGLCTVLVGHPLDLIKVRMQTAATMGVKNSVGTPSVGGMLTTIFRTEGIAGLYRGVSAPIVAVSPLYAVSFWGYDMGKRLVQWWHQGVLGKPPIEEFTIAQIAVAGGLSAIPCTVFMAPTERIKCLLQIQQQEQKQQNTTTKTETKTTTPTKPKYNGMLDCARQLYKEGGIRSIYRGTAATLLRDIPGSIAWFGTYEICKRHLVELAGGSNNGILSSLAILTSGGLAGMACWGVAIPPDTLKSRLQTAPEGTYSGLWHVYRDLVQKEGYAALFTGIRPAMIRAFPANAACFFGMEVAKSALSFMD